MHRSLIHANLIFLLVLAAFLPACVTEQHQHDPPIPETIIAPDPDSVMPFLPTTIAFGSCNRQDEPQPLWPIITAQQPDLWIWLGDNIYADTRDMTKMTAQYHLQEVNPAYRAFIQKVPVIGTWDDHDFGTNDGDSTYPKKEESKELLFDFLRVPMDAKARSRDGAYLSYLFRENGMQVKVILLDGRTFRSPLVKENGKYVPDPDGTLLGEAQWQWLEAELSETLPTLYLIGCGIQFLPEQHPFEKWANFPSERLRLFQLLASKRPFGVLLLSGDRHIGEISCLDPGYTGLRLCEVTSSGLTHSWHDNPGEANPLRTGPLVTSLNFGTIDIQVHGDSAMLVTAKLHDPGGEIVSKVDLNFE